MALPTMALPRPACPRPRSGACMEIAIFGGSRKQARGSDLGELKESHFCNLNVTGVFGIVCLIKFEV
jgi:hypothetical protein